MRSRVVKTPHVSVFRFSLLSLVLAFAVTARAADPKIEGLSAGATHGKVTVRFSLANVFTNDEIVQAMQSGLPTSFTYEIEIFRDRPYWLNDGVARSRVEVIGTFNSVTREYLLNYRRDRKLVRSETFTDIRMLERAMTAIVEPDLFDIGNRKPYKLKVRVRADLMRGWVLYVVPWEVSTRWREARVVALDSK
jgi:hypothetical protein